MVCGATLASTQHSSIQDRRGRTASSNSSTPNSEGNNSPERSWTPCRSQVFGRRTGKFYNRELPQGSPDGLTPKRYWETWCKKTNYFRMDAGLLTGGLTKKCLVLLFAMVDQGRASGLDCQPNRLASLLEWAVDPSNWHRGWLAALGGKWVQPGLCCRGDLELWELFKHTQPTKKGWVMITPITKFSSHRSSNPVRGRARYFGPLTPATVC